MTVSYFYRTPCGLHSIERVFQTVAAAMPPSVRIRSFFCRYRRGLPGCLYNLLEALGRQSAVNHITGDVHYLGLVLNRRRTVLTVHDCGTLNRLQGWRRGLVRLLWFEWPAGRAVIVTVVSEQSKAELLRWTSCPASKIRVVPNPLPPGFEPSEKSFNAAEPELLQLGTRDNKNLENVARAIQGLPCRLTIVGIPSPQQVSLLGLLGVRYSILPDLTDAELLQAYREADIVLFCSLYEGFGMPVIESNGIGRAVVASDIEPIKTVAEGAACLVDPGDPASIRQGILRLITDSAYREDLIKRGYANAARYRADAIAARYLAVYEEILPS